LGGIAVGIAAATFGVLAVPGWVSSAQDAAAVRDLSQIREAQTIASDVYGAYVDSLEDFTGEEWGSEVSLSSGVTLIDLDAFPNSWCATVKSESGTYFATSSDTVDIASGESEYAEAIGETCTLPAPGGPTPVISIPGGGGPGTPVIPGGPGSTITVTEIVCEKGSSPAYRFRYRTTLTAADGTWSEWTSWSPNRVFDISMFPAGALGGIEAAAKCADGPRESVPVPVPEVPVIIAIPTPKAPDVQVTPASSTTKFNWATTCPAGTKSRFVTADYRDDKTGWRAWDATPVQTVSKTRASADQGYLYRTDVKVQCYTAHATSGWSDAGSNQHIRDVVAPPTINKVSLVEWNGQLVSNFAPWSCGPGTSREWRGSHFMIGMKHGGREGRFLIYNQPYGANWQDAHLTGSHFSHFNFQWLKNSPGFQVDKAFATSMADAKAYFATLEMRMVIQNRCVNPDTGRVATNAMTVSPLTKLW
jgi:hypothetical protein